MYRVGTGYRTARSYLNEFGRGVSEAAHVSLRLCLLPVSREIARLKTDLYQEQQRAMAVQEDLEKERRESAKLLQEKEEREEELQSELRRTHQALSDVRRKKSSSFLSSLARPLRRPHALEES